MGQADITHQSARYLPGEVLTDEYRIPVLPAATPGKYRIITGVYITLPEGGWRRLALEDGSDSVVLAGVDVRPWATPPVTRNPMDRRFAAGYALVGVDFDHSLPQTRVYLHWRSDGPLAGGYRAVLLDGTSALAEGALPNVERGGYFSTAHDLPGDDNLALEVRDDQGKPSALSGLVPATKVALPRTSQQERYVNLGGEMILLRAEFPTLSEGGAPVRTRLVFLGAKAITRDYSVSVSLVGDAGQWKSQHDGTPALGAIPTYKWLRGATISDPHEIVLPDGASGRASLWLTVYDAYTVKPLPVLDDRLARLGQGTQMQVGAVEVR